jgi:hypothetical protein
MNSSRDPDVLIRAFIEDGIEELPNRSYDVVRASIDTTRQWAVIGPWKEPQIMTATRFALIAAAIAVMAVAAIRFLPVGGGFGGPPATPTPTPTPSPAPTVALHLEGIWHAGPVTHEDIRNALQNAGLEQWTDDILADRAAESFYTLSVQNGDWVLDISENGSPYSEIDAGQYSLNGDRVSVQHGNCVCRDDFRWSIEDGQLRIDFLSDTWPPREGIPEAAMETFLYESVAFLPGPPPTP